MTRTLAMLRALLGWLVSRAKPRRWGLTVAALALAANIVALRVEADPYPMSDGAYTWLYARSIVFDHDIDFKNDYALCGDKFHHNEDRGGGHADNPFYIGPSIFWVPALAVARHLHHFPPGTLDAVRYGCTGPIVATTLHIGALVGALVVWLSYLAARRFADDYAAALTAALFAFGTTLSAYATYESAYSHVYDAACIAALLLLSLRAYERPASLVRWALAGVALGSCILHRPTNLPLGLIPSAFAVVALRSSPRRAAAAIAGVGVTSFALGALPLLLLYRYLYGRAFGVVPQGQYYIQPGHPHVWLLLFAAKGLFFLAPVVWLSVAGGVRAVRRPREHWRLLVVLAALAVEVYIASIPLDWDGRSTIGARRLVPLVPLFAVLAAVAVGPAVAWVSASAGRVRVLVTGLVLGPLAMVFIGEGIYYSQPEHYYDYYPSQQVVYGNAFAASWQAIDERIGALAILPAQLLFSLRYHLPRQVYWKATHLFWYRRDYHTLGFVNQRLELKDRGIKAGVRGMVQDEAGAALTSPTGALVFCSEWPFATHLAIVASADQPTVLDTRLRSFFGATTRLAPVRLGPEETRIKLPLPRGAYDSGMQEILFDGDVAAGVHIRAIEFVDANVYAPVR